MGYASKYNKGNGYTTEIKGNKYVKLEELFNEFGAEQEYTVYAFYLNTKSKYGNSYVALVEFQGNAVYVNMPHFLTSTIMDMTQDNQLTDAINRGEFGFKIYEYHIEGRVGDFYSVNWVDINIEPVEVTDDKLPF